MHWPTCSVLIPAVGSVSLKCNLKIQNFDRELCSTEVEVRSSSYKNSSGMLCFDLLMFGHPQPELWSIELQVRSSVALTSSELLICYVLALTSTVLILQDSDDFELRSYISELRATKTKFDRLWTVFPKSTPVYLLFCIRLCFDFDGKTSVEQSSNFVRLWTKETK